MRRPTPFRCARAAWRGLAAACLLAAPLAGAEALSAAAPARITIGVLAVLDGEDTQRLWQPLADGLARALQGHSVRLQVLDPVALEAALAQQALHFVVTNPGHYVRLEARHGATRIATQTTAESDDPAHTVGSAVVVRAGTPVPATLQALRGQRVAAVAEDAFGGYQIAARELLEAGIDPAHDFSSLRYSGETVTITLDIRQTEEGELQLDTNQLDTIDRTVLQFQS